MNHAAESGRDPGAVSRRATGYFASCRASQIA